MEVLVMGLWVLLVVLAAALFVIRVGNVFGFFAAQAEREALFLDHVYARLWRLPECTPGNCYCRRTCEMLVMDAAA